MSENSAADFRPFGLTLDRSLQLAVPIIFATGAAYWFGVLRVVGLDYVTLLSVQDLLTISILILPLYLLMWMVSVGLNLSDFGQQPAANRKLSYYGIVTRDETGVWREKSENIIYSVGRGTIAIGVGVSIAMLVQKPGVIFLLCVFVGNIAGGFVLQDFLRYRHHRFNDVRKWLIGVSAFLLMVLAFLFGALPTLTAQNRGGMPYVLNLQDGSTRDAGGIQKLGEHLLYFDRTQRSWVAIRSDKVDSFSLSFPIEEPSRLKKPNQS
ncbi:MAG TPA: hypothetical protein VGO52_12470 [Hyphomonadaceae bacterium]|nr:hypothetical protein [Hyphomonadaceae bacterium]